MKALYDVSFAGSVVMIGNVRVDEFIDDANPIDIQDIETANIEWSCNGRMIRTAKPAAVIISITVIPGSRSDWGLRGIWVENFNNGGSVDVNQANKGLSCSITLGNGKHRYSFRNGTCIAGGPIPGSNGQGKMGGNTYTFAFENIVGGA